jgi:O-acetyl-ADP-ribose deacetylase
MNTLIQETVFLSGQKLQLVLGDISAEKTEAIVNAANRFLRHGGGVAGAILRAGGPAIQKESDTWVAKHGEVKANSPAVTTGGKLASRYVIHAVGPVWGEGDEEKKLSDAAASSLRTAQELKLESISIPAISTGIFGFPRRLAAKIILTTIRDYLEQHQGSLKVVRVVIDDEGMIKTFAKAWNDLFGA